MPLPMLAEQRLSLVTCAECGVEFAIPTPWEKSLRESHARFYCPAGHPLSYGGETEAERLKKEADALRKRLEFQRNETEAQRRRVETQKRRAAAARGQTTRIRNRIAKGQCPCCGRGFADLAAHMSTKHPDYAEPKP